MEVAMKSIPSKSQANIILLPRNRVSRYYTRFRYYFSTKCRHYIILDNIEIHSLKDILVSNDLLPEEVVKYIAANLITAIKELHRHNRAYGALSPENVLIRKDGSIVVKRTYFGSTYWTKEECLECNQRKSVDEKCTMCQSNSNEALDRRFDWLCLGVLICIMMTSYTPLGTKFKDYRTAVEHLQGRSVSQYCLPDSLKDEASDLILKLMGVESRSCGKKLTSHSFFSTIDWRKARNLSLDVPCLLRRKSSMDQLEEIMPRTEIVNERDHDFGMKTEGNKTVTTQDEEPKSLTQKIAEAEELLRSAKERLDLNSSSLNDTNILSNNSEADTDYTFNNTFDNSSNENLTIELIVEHAKQISLASLSSSPTKREIKQRLYGRNNVLRNLLTKYGYDLDLDKNEAIMSRDYAENEADGNNENIYQNLSHTSNEKSCKEAVSCGERLAKEFTTAVVECQDYQNKANLDGNRFTNGNSFVNVPRLLIEESEFVSEEENENLLNSNGMVREANIRHSSELNGPNIESIEEISKTIESKQNGIVNDKMIQDGGNPFIMQHNQLQPTTSSSSAPENSVDMVVHELNTKGYTPSPYGRSGSFDCSRSILTVTSDEALYPPSTSRTMNRGRSSSLMTPNTINNNNNTATDELMDKLRILGHLNYGRKLSPRLSSSTASLPRSPKPRHKIFHIGDNDSLHNSEIDVRKSSGIQGEKPCSPVRTMSFSVSGVDEIQESIIKRSQLYRTTSGVRNFKEKTALSRSHSAGCPVDPKPFNGSFRRTKEEQSSSLEQGLSCVTEVKETIFSKECATVETAPWTPKPVPKQEKTRKNSSVNKPNKNTEKSSARQRRISHSKAFFQEALNLSRSDPTGNLESSVWKQRLPLRRKSVATVCECKSCGKSMTLAEKKISKDVICAKCQSVRTERKEAIMELIQTEVNFGEDLWILKEEFQLPMKTGGILNQEQLSAVFVNLQELIDVNSKLCATVQDGLQDCLAKGDQEFLTLEVGKVFLDNVEFLQAFEQFCSRQHQAVSTIETLQKKSEILRVFLNVSRKENTKLRKMDLKSFLAMPVQRIMKYPLLLNRIYKATPADHSDREALRHAQKRIEELISNTNEISKGKTPKLKKSRSTNTLHRADSSDTKQMVKTVAELLNWKTEETTIALNTHFEVCQADLIGCDDAAKIRSKKSVRVNALLCIRGVEDDFDIDGSTSSISMDTHDAVVILLKKKVPNKVSVHRAPISLKECVFSCHEDMYFRDMFELLPMNCDPLTLIGDHIEEVSRWKHAVSWLIDDLAAWRLRRNAMANIMLKSLS